MLRSLMVLLLTLPWLAAGSGVPGATAAFVNVSVIPMDRERVLAGQTVVVRQGHIIAMGPAAQVKVPAGAERIDGRGKFLIPGLADMHVHPGQRGGGSPTIQPDAEYDFVRYLGLGATTVRVMAGSPKTLAWREQAAKGELLAPRIYTASPPIFGDAMRTPDAAKALVAKYKAEGYDFLKLYVHVNGGVTPEVFDTFVAATQREGIRFAGHAPSAIVGLNDMLRGHAASIEHLTGYMDAALELFSGEYIVGAHVPEADIPALAAATRRAGVWNCPTAGSIMERANDQVSALFPKVIKALSDSGAGLLLGTDDGWLPNDIDKELQALVDAGLTPYQALATGTRNVAQFFGTLDSTGTIAVGKRADLVLLDGNPLQNIGNVKRPAGVMLHGQWLSRDVLEARVEATKKVADEAWAKLDADEEAGQSAGQAQDTAGP